MPFVGHSGPMPYKAALYPHSRGQDVIPWDLLAEIDFFVSSYSLTLS